MTSAFPPLGWWWASILSIAFLAASTFRANLRCSALCGALAGAAFFGPLLVWMRVVGTDAWVALSLVNVLWWAGLFMAQSLAQRLRWWPVLVACLWVAMESLRGAVPLGGFPWGRIAYAQVSGPLLPLAAVVGAAGLAFLAALAGCLTCEFARRAALGERSVILCAPGALLIAVLIIASAGLIGLPEQAARVTVAVVQGGTPGDGLTAMGERRAVLANHVRLTRQLAALQRADIDLILWPENATDIDPFSDLMARNAIDDVVDEVGVPVLVGAVVAAPNDATRVANSGILWLPDVGPTQRYIKQHPVPFGEYIPMREILGSWIDRFRLVPRDFISGERAGLFDIGGIVLGDVICFEVAYDSIVGEVVRSGAQLLVVQTNNATYGGTAQLQQQVAIAQLRAVEYGRPVIVAATSGISTIIDVDGSIREFLGDGESGVIVDTVTPRSGFTIATAIGVWLQGIIVAAATFVLVVGAVARLKATHARRMLTAEVVGTGYSV
ncbi:MAG: apolipoprotein N-acyltransferase [Candidatus Nanopelagicales bacterium]|nr:apolipoprotein N-acyltransferase [Candidatus Nanopelagicales bacterium]